MYNKKKVILYPDMKRTLSLMGEQIRLARLRRKITLETVVNRTMLSRSTVWKIEKGDPTVSIGAYTRVLKAIGIMDDLLLIAKDDEYGRLLQDAELDRRRKT
ncbi:MAG: helix-turn-helix transcriptional regulator [Saccharofermentans sp.]|nr:helix-turn-helix transcriptional regulator [Clostridiales bacterium]MDY6340271.1 helix-turn-helix transcriptional regulator [Saccharofermentans sp.]